MSKKKDKRALALKKARRKEKEDMYKKSVDLFAEKLGSHVDKINMRRKLNGQHELKTTMLKDFEGRVKIYKDFLKIDRQSFKGVTVYGLVCTMLYLSDHNKFGKDRIMKYASKVLDLSESLQEVDRSLVQLRNDIKTNMRIDIAARVEEINPFKTRTPKSEFEIDQANYIERMELVLALLMSVLEFSYGWRRKRLTDFLDEVSLNIMRCIMEHKFSEYREKLIKKGVAVGSDGIVKYIEKRQ